MAASLAQGRRASHHIFRCFEVTLRPVSHSRCHAVRRQFPRTRQVVRQTTSYGIVCGKHPPHEFFGKRLAVFHHQYLTTVGSQAPHQVCGQRILGDFKNVELLRSLAYLRHIVISYTAGQYAHRFLSRSLFVTRVRSFGRSLFQTRLLFHQRGIFPARIGRKEHPTGRILRTGQRPHLFGFFLHRHGGPGMCQTHHDTHQHRQLLPFGKFEAVLHHVVRLLLSRRFQGRYHGKLTVETGVLFILRRVHGRVVRHNHDHAAVHARNGSVDKSICRHVQPYVLHASYHTRTGVGCPQSRLDGSLFVRTPRAVQTSRTRQRMPLDVFGDFRARRPRISIHSANACMDSPEGYGLIT